MLKAVLFDLDGTLLPMDTEKFIGAYLKKLAPTLADWIDPKEFAVHLMTATKDMVINDEPHRTNEEVFISSFCQRTGLKKEEIWPQFDHFYENVFPSLVEQAKPGKTAKDIIQLLLKQGYKIAVATNPVFPKIAILERMRWAGIADLPIEYVTSYEENHFCKPNPKFYLEVADRLGVRPEECLMVGNDMQEDMISSVVGMKTYLLHEFRIDRGKPQYEVDYEGTMEELLEMVRNQEEIFQKAPLSS